MEKLVIHNDKIENISEFLKVCPFGALQEIEGKVEITSACKMCGLCIKKGPKDVAEMVGEEAPAVDKDKWKGIAVYIDHLEGEIHPVTYELIGKAKELAKKIHQPVFALFMGYHISDKCHEVLHYDVDEVFVYDDPALDRFKIEAYTAAFEDFINRVKPCAVLVGATTVGRQLAPRVAARFRTGLTADCTQLEIKENSDLVQIRPAFGGNVMAQILTPNHRPQMATVRYNVMNAPKRQDEASGKITSCHIDPNKLKSHVKVIDIIPKEKEKTIESADILVVAGRGVKSEKDLPMLHELADLLGGELACTRPMAEFGWIDAKRQIGLSGRTVRPKLIITCGVSGSIQFIAGMDHSDCIIAMNKDPKASIFQVANYGIVGDIYQIIPDLIAKIKAARGASRCIINKSVRKT